MKYLNYDETMALVEDFMQKSGVAKFCRESCKGVCCGGCYTFVRVDGHMNACHYKGNEGGRRLSCTSFICGDLFYYLRKKMPSQGLPGNVRGKWIVSKERILRVVKPYVLRKHTFKQDFGQEGNPYYDPPANFPKLKKNFKILESDVTLFFNEKIAAEIYDAMKNLPKKMRIWGQKVINVYA